MINNIVKMGGAPEGYDAALIAKEFEVSNSCVIHIARDDKRMAAVKDALAFFAPDLRVEIFPVGIVCHTTVFLQIREYRQVGCLFN